MKLLSHNRADQIVHGALRPWEYGNSDASPIAVLPVSVTNLTGSVVGMRFPDAI